jgi:NADH-quinone oxidoreductase subunit L
MLIVTVADNLLLMLVGWEIMGVCSYFLIGHYWESSPTPTPSIKAFLTTRVGDVGFMLGIVVAVLRGPVVPPHRHHPRGRGRARSAPA